MRLSAQIGKVDLLYIDDFGLAPLAHQSKRELPEILEDRYDKKSTLITSQLPIDQWHAYIDEPTLASSARRVSPLSLTKYRAGWEPAGVTVFPASFHAKLPRSENNSSLLPRYLDNVLYVSSLARTTTVSIPWQSAQGSMQR